MSYTLRGRLESRLAAALVAVVAAAALAAALGRWWPLELAALMVGVGLVLDVLVYDRLLDYQPGWLAVPLGLVELGAVMGLAVALRIDAPLGGALALYAGAWLAAQALGHAALPLVRLSYAEGGGELGRAGPLLAVAVAGTLAAAAGTAWAMRVPTVHLRAGVHQGPLVLDRAQHLVGEPGAVVRGGILVRANGVTISRVTVIGGENGIDVEHARDVVLDRVSISGARLDGIHVRRGQVHVRNCSIDQTGPWAQGIDISFAYDFEPSVVEGCTIVGGHEGIVTHSAMAMLMGNSVRGTRLRGIDMTEMSMGHIERNVVTGSLGVAIFCGDRSMCTIEHNTVADTRPDRPSGDRTRAGYAILAHFESEAEIGGNVVSRSPGGIAAMVHSRLIHLG